MRRNKGIYFLSVFPFTEACVKSQRQIPVLPIPSLWSLTFAPTLILPLGPPAPGAAQARSGGDAELEQNI